MVENIENSKRTSAPILSVMLIVLCRASPVLFKPGPTKKCRFAVPRIASGGVEKLLVEKYMIVLLRAGWRIRWKTGASRRVDGTLVGEIARIQNIVAQEFIGRAVNAIGGRSWFPRCRQRPGNSHPPHRMHW
jgi:hypothetical protein